jgi:hypothetical protein
MQIVNGNPDARPTATNRLPGITNYFIGNDPAKWHTNVSTFGRVEYDDVYPGIDLAYYGAHPSPPGRGDGGEDTTTHHSPLTTHQLEYDFIVSPGADPNQIQLSFSGADSVTLDADGNLILRAGDTQLRQQKPYIYQDIDGTRQQVRGEFRVQNSEQNSESRIQNSESSRATDCCLPTTAYSPPTDNCLLSTDYSSSSVSFQIGAYDKSLPLVIDPLVLGYSTYLGAGNEIDAAYDIAVDDNGHAYVTGETRSLNFPATDGAFDETFNGSNNDAFVAKLNRNGSALLYATYLGGAGSDQAGGIAVDGDGNAYVTGGTWSKNFPTTPGAFDETFNGIIEGFMADAFVTKLSPDGSKLIYSTYLGGRNSDGGQGLAVAHNGSAFVFGGTTSSNFPVTSGAFDTVYDDRGDPFIAKLNPTGSALIYATYLGGDDEDLAGGIAIDTDGHAFVTGSTASVDFPTTAGAFSETFNGGGDAYVTKLAPDGSALLFSTFVGGDVGDGGMDIALDARGEVYVAGGTGSVNFPVTPGAYDTTHFITDGADGFATKLNATGSGLIYSTFVGAGTITANALAIDNFGNAYLTGHAEFGMETTPDAFDRAIGGANDAFFMKLNSTGSALAYSTYIGGAIGDDGFGIALDRHASAYIAGQTTSRDFPTTPHALKRRNQEFTIDGFVTKFTQV